MADAQPLDLGPRDGGPPLEDGAVGDAATPSECMDPLGPAIAITAPAPAADPVADDVVVGAFAQVSCSVMRNADSGSEPVDSESVVIEFLDADGAVLATPAVTSEGDSYRAQIALEGIDSGPVTFRCEAQDSGAEPRCNSAEIDTFIDRGPSIEVLSPSPGSIHAERMLLRYRLRPDPLADGDTEAVVADHMLVVAGAILEPAMEGDDYVVDVDFTNRTLFPEPLSGDYELSIVATNQRTPTAAERRHAQPFTVDTDGPVIVIDTPDEGDLVGGATLVSATITDDAGVDPSTVVLRAAGMSFPMTPMAGTDEFRVSFDASVFPTTVVELTLNIAAEDVVGNAAAVSRSVKLDAVAPILSLDPPEVREAQDRMMQMQCSELFDPLGVDTVNDGAVAGTTPELRVRAYDLSNSSFGGEGTVIFFAGIRDVEVLVLDGTSTPLLVDLDSDGVCDAVNPAAEPNPANPDSAVLIQMSPITPGGSAFYSEGDKTAVGTPAEAYGSVFAECVAGTNSTPPTALCPETSPLTRVIARPDTGDPQIFAKEPIGSDTCVGDSWDFVGAGISEGWACVVARAEDHLGNVGVSPPLRVCLSDGVGDNPCGAAVGTIRPEGERPSCTDGCAIPTTFADLPSLQRIGPSP